MKKFVLLILLMLFSTANAATVWNLSGTSGNWNVAGNWNNGVPGTVAPAETKAVLNLGAAGAECQVTDTQAAEFIVIGDGGPGGDVVRITSGGNLTSTDWFSVGYSRNAQMIVETGGVVNIDGHLWMAAQDPLATNCILDINGGTVNVTGNIGLGTVNASTPSGGVAFINVNAGTLNLTSWSATGSIQNGSAIDIELGAVVIDGNQTAVVIAYAAANKITAYGGSSTLNVDYDVPTPGKTTITTNPPERAANPTPDNGQDDASTFTVLSWTAGLYATSHDVYFGTDSTPDAGEFKDNQPGTTFDPGVLDLNTTYYWRIDEVDTGNPASPWTGIVWSFTTRATSTFGKIVYPWNATTALVKAGQTFEVWFDADPGQTVSSVELRGPYNTVNPSMSTPVIGSWAYDKLSGNTCNNRITVTVPTNAPEDRYDLLLNTSYGQAISVRSVKVVSEYRSEFYFLHHSDLHMLSDGMVNGHPKNLAALSAVIDAANIIGVEVVIATGDNQGFDFDSHFLSTTQQGFDFWFNGHAPAGLKGTLDFDAATLEAHGNHTWSSLEGLSWYGLGQQKATWWNQYAGLVYGNVAYGQARFMTYNNGWMQVTEQIDGNNWYVHQLLQQSQWLNSAGDGNLRVFGYHILPGDSSPDTNAINSFLSSENIGMILYGHWHVNDIHNPNNQSGVPAYSSRGMMGSSEPWFNLFKVDSAGNFTWIYQPDAGQPNGLGTSLCPVENRGADYTAWIPKLKIDYTSANDGTSSTNTATLTNSFDVGFDAARVRFVMPNGMNYGVSAGTIDQQFDGDQYHIVDVSVASSAHSTIAIDINSSGSSGLPAGASARGENVAAGEIADNAFDGNPATKWLDYSPTGSWIQWRYADGIRPTVRQYAITSADDMPQRDPMDWNLLGSNDHGYTWDVLDSRTGITFASRFEKQNFAVTNPGVYNIYRLDITAVYDVTTATAVQLAEFKLPLCVGFTDFNCNGIIGIDDFSYIAGVWMTADPTADVAEPTDGLVGLPDLLILAEEWLYDSLIDGAVAYWKLDESAGITASDYSPNGYDGTLVNMDDSDWVPGKTGNALNFDGTNNYVAADAVCAEMAGGDVTVSAWMKADALNPANQFIIATNSSAGDNILMFGTQANTATLSFVDSEPLWRDTPATVIDNTWHHIAYVLDDSFDTVTIYVDGGQALSFASTVSVDATDLFSLGQEYDAGPTTGDFYKGRLDDVRVYNYALSDTEIRRLHDPSGLIAHWKLDETSGTVAENDATYGYDATLVNMDDSDWVGGNTGNALDFDGVNDYVVIDDICAAMAGKDVTVSAWVKAPAVNPATQFIISINTSTGDNRLLCGTPAGTATLSLGDTAWHDTTAAVIDNTWHHIAYVLEDSSDTIIVYVDGIEALSFTSTISIAATDLLSLGQEYDPPMTPGDFYDGLLDDVRIYDRALSETEIAILAQ